MWNNIIRAAIFSQSLSSTYSFDSESLTVVFIAVAVTFIDACTRTCMNESGVMNASLFRINDSMEKITVASRFVHQRSEKVIFSQTFYQKIPRYTYSHFVNASQVLRILFASMTRAISYVSQGRQKMHALTVRVFH